MVRSDLVPVEVREDPLIFLLDQNDQYRAFAVNIPPLKEEISDFQIKSGEINFWRKLTRLRKKMWGKLTFLEKIRKKVNFPRDPFLENPLIFFRLRRANLPCKFIISKLKTPKFFACGGLFPLKNTFLIILPIKKSLAAGQFTL